MSRTELAPSKNADANSTTSSKCPRTQHVVDEELPAKGQTEGVEGVVVDKVRHLVRAVVHIQSSQSRRKPKCGTDITKLNCSKARHGDVRIRRTQIRNGVQSSSQVACSLRVTPKIEAIDVVTD